MTDFTGPAPAPPWAGQAAWRVLDTQWQGGGRFLATWQAWHADPQRPRLLHYVAIADDLPDSTRGSQLDSTFNPAAALAAQCTQLQPGFNRLVFDHGRVLLTLCIGPLKTMLREQAFVADSVHGPGLHPMNGGVASAPLANADWDAWAVKSLARCCQRGTWVATGELPDALAKACQQNGFALHPAPELPGWRGRYDPQWEPKNTRLAAAPALRDTGRCVVIGAGVAGASVAASLARRGWQVTVLDSAPEPAAGASALPVGLMVASASADDNPRSRLTRQGVRLTLQQAHQHLVEGEDWYPSGALERKFDGSNDVWHAQAAWLKPNRLVRAWLAQPGVQFQGSSTVAAIAWAAGQWTLHGGDGRALAQADAVVLAAGTGSKTLIAAATQAQAGSKAWVTPAGTRAADASALASLHNLPGQVSWGLHGGENAMAFPDYPVNGLGNFLPFIPVDGARAWFLGATYETIEAPGPAHLRGHAENFARLTRLLPHSAAALTARFDNRLRSGHGSPQAEPTRTALTPQDADGVHAWRGVRCTTHDRLPLVGAVVSAENPSTLWVCTGLGSRGLSWAVLCAELLAAKLSGEPLPVAASLAKTIDVYRR